MLLVKINRLWTNETLWKIIKNAQSRDKQYKDLKEIKHYGDDNEHDNNE